MNSEAKDFYFEICQITTEEEKEEDMCDETLNEMVAQELTKMVRGWDKGEGA